MLAGAKVYVSLDEKDGRSARAHPTQRNPSRRPRNLPVPTVMGKREKRPKPTSDESAEAEAWLAECSAAKLEPVKQQPPPPAWPDPVQHYGALAAAALASPPTDPPSPSRRATPPSARQPQILFSRDRVYVPRCTAQG